MAEKIVSSKIQKIIASIHFAFMQPRKADNGDALRKQYWLDAWSSVKKLNPKEMDELIDGLETIRDTLSKLENKIRTVRDKKIQKQAMQSLSSSNEWEEDEFLSSKADLPVFKPVKTNVNGKRWVITEPLERPKTLFEICQCIWTVLTNRAITLLDGSHKNVSPSLERDNAIEKHRLSALSLVLADMTVTDPLTSKPLMNIYMISKEVKEKLLRLLAERAKKEANFRKLYVQFLKVEILDKIQTHEWAQKFAPCVLKILHDMKSA